MKTWKKVRVKSNLLFKKYTPSNLKRLTELSNKIVEIQKVTKYFYKIKNEDVVIFFADFTLEEEADPYKQVKLEICV